MICVNLKIDCMSAVLVMQLVVAVVVVKKKSLSSTKVSVDKLSGLCDDLDSKGVDCEGDSKIVVSDAFELRDDNELLHVFVSTGAFNS